MFKSTKMVFAAATIGVALLAPITAAIIADVVEGHCLPAPWEPFSPARFEV